MANRCYLGRHVGGSSAGTLKVPPAAADRLDALQRLTPLLSLKAPHVLAVGLSLAMLGLVAASPVLLGDQVRDGITGLHQAAAVWLWVAATCFVASLVTSGLAWRGAIRSCDGSIGVTDASARYGIGCLVNSLSPIKLGTPLRVGLYSRALPGDARLWTAGGICTAIGAAQTFWLLILVAIAAAAGVLPVWPIALLVAALAAAGVAVWIARHSRPARRFAHVLDAFRALGTSPRAAGALLGWTGVAAVMRIGAGAGLAAAFGLPHPLAVAFLIVPAVELASFLPLTPANIGVTAAAVAFALHTQGIHGDVALSMGIAFNAVETVSSLAFGAGGALYLATGSSRVRPRLAAFAGATACAALAGAFSLTVFAPLG
jgi:uncharacterized membrane protein YbhN (UPF0104 family)